MKLAVHNEEIIVRVQETEITIRFHDDIQPGVHKVNINLTGDFNRAFALIGDQTLKSETRRPITEMAKQLVLALYAEREQHAGKS